MTYALARSPARVEDGDEGSAERTLAEWFDGASDVPVSEEVVGLGPCGRVLTVLTCGTLPSAESFRAAEESLRSHKGDRRDAVRPWGWDRMDDTDND